MNEKNADPNLAAIKARLSEVRAAMSRGDARVDVGAFTMPQLGLTVPVIDEAGRIWRFEGQTLVRLGVVVADG